MERLRKKNDVEQTPIKKIKGCIINKNNAVINGSSVSFNH